MLGHFVDGFGSCFLGRTHRSNSQHCGTYLTSLGALEHSLSFMGYLRDKPHAIRNPIYTEAQNVALERCAGPVLGQQRKSYVNRT